MNARIAKPLPILLTAFILAIVCFFYAPLTAFAAGEEGQEGGTTTQQQKGVVAVQANEPTAPAATTPAPAAVDNAPAAPASETPAVEETPAVTAPVTTEATTIEPVAGEKKADETAVPEKPADETGALTDQAAAAKVEEPATDASSKKDTEANDKAATDIAAAELKQQDVEYPDATIKFQVHVQNIGNQGWRYEKSGDDKVTQAGTSGRSLRLEGLWMSLESSVQGNIEYQVHVQNVGWQKVMRDGQMAGTSGKSYRLEGLRIMLTGELSKYYDIEYRVHVQNDGWQGFVKNGAFAGTEGRALRLEALEVKLVKKETPLEEGQEGIIGLTYRSHVQNIGNQAYVNSPTTTGTTGQSLRVEAMQFLLNSGIYKGGITYQAHVENIGWQKAVSNGASAGTSGRGLRMEALKINLTGDISNYYDVVYRAHVQNIGWQAWTYNGGVAGTSGKALRVEAIQIKLMKKGSTQSFADGGYYITVANNETFALDDTSNSTDEGTQMQVWTHGTGYAQRFNLTNTGSSTFTLQPVSSALYLTDSNGLVTQQAATDGREQRWIVVWNAGYIIKNVATGNVFTLTADAPKNGVKVQATKDAAANNQRWIITDTGLMPDGTYTFNNVKSGRVLDTWYAKRYNGGDVKIGNANNGNNQKYTITYLGNQQYSIRNVATKRAMQVSGTNVNMWTYKGSNTQKWKTQLAGAKTFRFVIVSANKAMDVEKGSTENGANVYVNAIDTSSKSQMFTLVPTSRIQELVNIGVPVIYQNPELPTGCESVALTEALNYYGFGLAKTTIADDYMPWSGSDFVYHFLGNPHSSSGAAIMAPGITNTANKFLRSMGSDLRATNITGTSFGALYEYLDRGVPVVVWNTMYMGSPGGVQMSSDGYNMRSGTHAVTLSGYDPSDNTVLVADPLSGSVWRPRGAFERLYNIMGKQAVVIE